MWEVHRPGSVSDLFDRHFRQRSEAVGQSLDDRGSGGSGQFSLDRHVDKRNAPEQFGGSGSGNGADAVVDVNLAVSGRDRAADDRVGSEQVETDGRTDDVDDRIDRANFVEVNFVDGRSVDVSLGGGHCQKDLPCQCFL